MSENNVFVVNTDVDETAKKVPQNKKFDFKFFIKRNIFYVVISALLVVILFCAVVPVCKEYHIFSGTATGADGEIIEVNYYNRDGLVYKNEKYTEGEAYSVTENTYKRGLLTKIDVYYWDELFETTTVEYDGKNKLSQTAKDSSGEVTSVETFYYDEYGTLINSVVTDETGAQRTRYDYTFENGNLVKKAQYDIEYDYTRVTNYTYEDGRLISENIVAGAYHNKTIEYSYNSRGFLSMQKSDSSEEDYISYTYEYDVKRVSVFGKIF